MNPFYRAVLRRLAPLLYRAVNAGWYWCVIALCHPNVVARMAGSTPLSGTSRAAYRLWFERAASMCAMHLTVQDVQVTGTIRDTRLEVAWNDRLTLHDGTTFNDPGRHIAELRWGRLTSITYEWNTETVQAVCDHAAKLERRGTENRQADS